MFNSSKKITILIFILATFGMIALVLLLKPIAQPAEYHHFADQRTWLGIPNVANVLSNLPFALVGVWALYLLFSPGKIQLKDRRERGPWILLAMGLILTAFGSSYYHWSPDNASLVLDRLPMTLVFMSFVAIIICERVNLGLGLWLWPVLVGLGVFSVLYWYASELRHAGDLRLYLALQIYPFVLVTVLLVFESSYTKSLDLLIIAALYGLSKMFETFDKQIFICSDRIISGHTLKHLAAALASFWLVRMLWKRRLKDENSA